MYIYIICIYIHIYIVWEGPANREPGPYIYIYNIHTHIMGTSQSSSNLVNPKRAGNWMLIPQIWYYRCCPKAKRAHIMNIMNIK